jgi:predicted GNAT family N-acyltransferase
MKPGTITLGNASLHIGYPQIIAANQRGHAREITGFIVPEEHRGKGEGSALLQDVCEQADQDKLLLIITADTLRLASFYAKHGFVAIQANPILMARSPIC